MNRSLRCLSLACLALALFGCEPPTTCKDGDCIDPPKACDQLGESDCLARADCAATYVESDCAPAADCGGRAFVSCAAKQQCPVIDCAPLDCPHGLARDAQGCVLCACSPVPCSSNAECPAGQVCLFPALKCEPGATCAPPRGTCGVVEQGCDADADCAVGERCIFPTQPACPPNAFCAPPRGTCKPAQGCATDEDCGLGRFCDRLVGTGADQAAPCEAPGCLPLSGTCRERTSCTSAVDCAVGQVCAMDPSDPCTKNACPMYLPAQLFCLPACPGLDEAACLARNDCEAMWAPAPGEQDKRAGFAGCKPAGCPPVVCAMWCPNGFARDASGCEICSCAGAVCSSDADCRAGQICVFGSASERDCAGEGCGVAPAGVCRDVQQGCQTDAECAPNERCEVAVYDVCPPGEACPPLYGRCVPRNCTSDADCLPGQACVWPGGETDCAEADCRVAAGTCQVVQQGCQSDAECAPTEYCLVAVYDVCPPGETCPPLYGKCVARSCMMDADCLAGQRCAMPDVYCPPDTYCAPPMGVCVAAGCRADVECRPGEVCTFAVDACPPGDPACPNVGICAPAPTACTDDSQCAPGLRCSANPMTNCGPTTNCVGQCVPNVCALDADCRGNERCLLADCAPGADCGGAGFCVTLPACLADADCAAGQSCQPDPTDLCNDPAALCERPGRQICK